MSELSAKDAASIWAAKKDGVLRNLEDEKFDFQDGVIAVVCADGDRTEKRRHLESLVATKTDGHVPRVHLITTLGASLALPWRSPLSNVSPFLFDFLMNVIRNRLVSSFVQIVWPIWWMFGWLGRHDIQLIVNIWKSVQMKQIKTIVLYVHAPCGAAGHCGITFLDQLRYLTQAKRRLEWWLSDQGVKVACFCHVDYGMGKQKNTYFVSRHEAEAWLARR